jgi:hypothetical protein
MSDLKPIKVRGDLHFCKDMHVINTFFDEDNDRYECTIGNLSEAAAKALDEMGICVKTDDKRPELGKFVKSKSKFVFDPVDREGNKIDVTSVGTGTKVEALVTGFEHKLSKKWGKSVRVQKLIVTDLVEFNPSVAGGDEEEAL